MVQVNLQKSGNVFMVSGKPFDMPTFSALKNAGLLFWNSGIRGQLWEECSCGKEPVCAMCMKCSKHCTCGGGGWALTEKGIEAVIQKGFDVMIDGTKIASVASIADAEKVKAERLAKEKAERKVKYDQAVAELESKGIYIDQAKFNSIVKEWTVGMEHAGWDVTLKDVKVLETIGSATKWRSIDDKREPSRIESVRIKLFDTIETQAALYMYHDMEGYGQDTIYLPVDVIGKLKPLIEQRREKERLEQEERTRKWKIEQEKQRREYEEKTRKEAEARACKEKEDVAKIASIAESLSSLTKNQILSKYSQLVNEEIIMKSWPKDKLIAKISEVSVKGKFKKTSRSRDEDYETGDYGGY